MPSTFFGLTIGKSGLNMAQAGINTTAHNASNATTKGYSRQVVSSKATVPISVYTKAGMAGTGVEVTGVERQRNIYYDEKYRVSNAAYGNYDTKQYYLFSIQNYFKETDKDAEGITASMTSFYKSLEDLKDNPSDSTTRTAAIESANDITEFVGYLAEGLQNVQKEANTDIKTTAERINSIAAQIANLNKQINTLEIQGGTANDLRDSRDLLLDELSKYANITITEINRGDDLTRVNDFTVKLDGKTLVDTYRYNTLQISSVDGKVNQNDADGLYELTWSDGQEFNSASPSLGGKLQALFEVRDGNNETNFSGTAEKIEKGTNDDGTPNAIIKVKGTNCNDINKLNIPQEDGKIQVGNKLYTYDSFSVDINEKGEYTYTFSGLKDESGNTATSYDVNGKAVTIGSKIDFKGVPYYQAQLNEFVRTYAANFNLLHNEGQDMNGEAGMDFFNGTDPVTGENYKLLENMTYESPGFTNGEGYQKTYTITKFDSKGTAEGTWTKIFADGSTPQTENVRDVTSYYNVTALNFTVSKEVQNNVLKFACTSDIDQGVEGTDILDQLIGTKTDKSMFKEGRPSEFLETFTANIGSDAKQAQLFATSQKNITEAIDEQRMSVSSVDEDEEAMNLVKYQKAYELNGKIISTMSQLYDILMNM